LIAIAALPDRLGDQRNAFGSANVCYMIARRRAAGRAVADRVAAGDRRALLTAGLVVLVILCFDLSGIAMMGSAAFCSSMPR
jgi:hypothetical protein